MNHPEYDFIVTEFSIEYYLYDENCEIIGTDFEYVSVSHDPNEPESSLIEMAKQEASRDIIEDIINVEKI